jgi:hypothetical protein
MYADLLDRSTLSGTVQKIPLQETQDSALSHRINSELFNLVDALTDVDFNTRVCSNANYDIKRVVCDTTSHKHVGSFFSPNRSNCLS